MAVNAAQKPHLGHVALVASGLAGVAVATRIYLIRGSGGRERLADALLDTERLHDVLREPGAPAEQLLTGCASYFLGVVWRAAGAQSLYNSGGDEIGTSLTRKNPYTRGVTTILTESASAGQIYTYAVSVPESGEMRGTRRVGPFQLTGLAPGRHTTDTAQITLPAGYIAQIEADFHAAEFLLTGRTRVRGALVLRDNQSNVARVNVSYDGALAGAITRDGRIIGRFDGSVASGLTYKPADCPD